MTSNRRIRIGIIGSGAGSNARALCCYALGVNSAFEVALIMSTSLRAGILGVAKEYSIENNVLKTGTTENELATEIMSCVAAYRIDVLVLAGFMRLLPMSVINDLHGHVMNIHPALLPAFGGNGMYGIRVHEAVIASGATESGATVHLVSEKYDEGSILGKAHVAVFANDTSATLQERVKEAEMALYSRVIQQFAQKLQRGSTLDCSMSQFPKYLVTF